MHFVVVILVSLVVAVFAIFRWDTNKPESFSSPPPAVTQSPSPKPSPISFLKSKVLLEVPFVAQAPTGNWDDPRQQDGCEEAAAWMAVLWATGGDVPKTFAKQEAKILEIADWEEKEYGSYHDTAAEDTVERIYKAYFGYEKVRVVDSIDVVNIKQELSAGNLVQVPADGRILANPNYTAPGPERHNLVIIGYDDATREFITNDNGTRRGKGYRYKYEVMLAAIRDYPTGDHLPIMGVKKAMIIISK